MEACDVGEDGEDSEVGEYVWCCLGVLESGLGGVEALVSRVHASRVKN